MNKNEIKQVVSSKVYENNTNDITGRGLQYAMNTMVDGLATQDEFDELASKVSNISLDINLKGVKPNEAEIKVSVTSPELGDTYKAADSGDYWRYSDKITPSTPYDPYKWVNIGNILPGEALKEEDIVNDLTTGGTKKVLSAEQGKIFYKEYIDHVDNLSENLHVKYVDYFDLDDIKDFGYYIVTKTVGKDIEKMILYVSNFKTTGKSDAYQVMISVDMLKTEKRYFKNETWSNWEDITPVTTSNFDSIFEGTLFEGAFNWDDVFNKSGSLCVKDSDLATNRPAFLVSTNNDKTYNIWAYTSVDNNPTFIIHDLTTLKSYLYSNEGVIYNIGLTKLAEEGDVPVFKNGKWETSQIDKLTTELEEQIKTKADNIKLTADNKLQLTAEGKDIGTPLELPSGILNLSHKNNTGYETSGDARATVKGGDRIIGQIVTYKLKEGNWLLDQFIGESTGSWDNEGSWQQYALANDLTPLIMEMSLLTGKVELLGSNLEGFANGAYTEDEDEENIKVIFTNNGDDVFDVILPKGGGGGGQTGITMKLRAIGGTSIVTGEGSDALVKYTWSSIDQETQEDTGDGVIYITVNGLPVYSGNVKQGDNEYNLKDNLNLGSNTVKVRVTDGYNNARTLTYNVLKASLLLTSTFADDTIYAAEPVPFRYTITGSGEKTIKFWLNGVQIGSDTTSSSGKQITKNLTGLVSGGNSIRVSAESMIEGSRLVSNELYYEFIYADGNVTEPVIVMSYSKGKASQFDTIEIPYLVYDPKNTNANIDLYIDNVKKQSLTVPRSRQIWAYNAFEQGIFKFEIRCGTITKSINVEVVPSKYDIGEERGNLSYKASAIGKSNFGDDRASWEYNNYDAVFSNFNWSEDGWHKDQYGNNNLRLIGDSKVEIGINPFSSTVLQNGLTLTVEYSTENVADSNAEVITCMSGGIGIVMTPSSVSISSAQETLEMKLDSSEKTSITFVVEKRSQIRLIYLYIDGTMSGVLQYPTTDNFAQNPVEGITLSTGGRGCNAHIYGLRWYENNLNFDQVFGNYIFDIENFDEKITEYEKNDVINDYNEVDYNKSLEFLPCLTIIGNLPQFKGDKKTVDLVYEDSKNSTLSFLSTGVSLDVQGTSSQYYPRKNYKWKAKNFTMTETGETSNMYQMQNTQIPASVFCMKADFAESSGTHNTGMAVLIQNGLDKLGYKIPPQSIDNRIRSTVYGYPCLIFHKPTESSSAEFIGKYNFNDDKSSEQVFGFTQQQALGKTVESWEFKNNTSDRSLFKSADFTGTEWLDDFEGRFPDGYEDPTNLKKVFEWVVSCIGNPTKFKAEAANHFNIQWLLFYCLVTELYVMVDQRAKNQFLTTYGEVGPTGELIWYFIFYDNDTVLGINNEGLIQFNYNVETKDPIGSGHVWNGWDSALWTLVESAYKDELKSLYQTIRQRGIFSVDDTLAILQTRQADKWCQAIYNRDGYYKYVDPLINGGNGAYLYALQGSRTKHRMWYTKNRINYIDSKYNTGTYMSDFATMRLYTPGTWTGVTPNSDFNLTVNKDSYFHVKYGSYVSNQVRGYSGNTYKITAPNIQFNDTETIIYGASAIKSFGDLSPKYAGTIDITNAIALEELIVGSRVTGYKNLNLTVLHTGSNELLRKINVANCPNLRQSLDLGKCYSIEEVEARGSGITGLALPKSGILKTLNLPASFTSIYLKNQPYLTTFTLEGYANINTLVIDKVATINGYDIAKQCLALPNNKLSKVRITNIDTIDNNTSTIKKILKMSGEDDNGIATPFAVLTGKIHFGSISASVLAEIHTKCPDLNVTYDTLLNVIEFEDPIVKDIMVANYDTNGDGEISEDEVKFKNIPANMLTDTGAKYFDEARYWGGTGTIINNVTTLEKLSIQPGRGEIQDLPNLRQLSIYAQHETIDATPLLKYTTVKNCYSIERFILSGRYIETAKKGAILAKQYESNIEYYRFVLPLRGHANVTIDEKVVILNTDFVESTYNWGKDLTQLTLNNLRHLTLPQFENLSTLIIRGFSEHAGNKIDFNGNMTILQNLIINDTNNSLDVFWLSCGKIRNIDIQSLICKGAVGSELRIRTYSQPGLLSRLDLSETYQPSQIIFERSNGWQNYPFTNNSVMILRSPNFIPCGGLDNWSDILSKYLSIYVPDGLVNTYKTSSGWTTVAGKIYPISNLG